jgi:hypothetical protein
VGEGLAEDPAGPGHPRLAHALEPPAVALVEVGLAGGAEIKAGGPGDTDNPRYDELPVGEHYLKHVLRLPAEEWPEPVVRSFARIVKSICVPLLGPSELGVASLLLECYLVADLHQIEVPTLVIGVAHDIMDPSHLQDMAAHARGDERFQASDQRQV